MKVKILKSTHQLIRKGNNKHVYTVPFHGVILLQLDHGETRGQGSSSNGGWAGHRTGLRSGETTVLLESHFGIQSGHFSFLFILLYIITKLALLQAFAREGAKVIATDINGDLLKKLAADCPGINL